MRLTVDAYLSELKERDELDSVLRNLLISEEYSVIREPVLGKREFGADVIAYKEFDDGYHLFLFQVKQGNFTRSMWEKEGDGIRASIRDAIDKNVKVTAHLPEKPVKRTIVVAFNGTISNDDVNDVFEGFIEQATSNYQDLEITAWNQSDLTKKICNSLMDESLMPFTDLNMFKKALAFSDIKDYEFLEFKRLLTTITEPLTKDPSKYTNVKKAKKLLSQIRLIGKMMALYAQQGDNYKNAVLSSEILILHLAHKCQEFNLHSDVFKDYFNELLKDYSQNLSMLMKKLEPQLKLNHGLAVGGMQETIEYPLRTFEILGLASINAMLKGHLGEDELETEYSYIFETVKNNPVVYRPLLDNHGVDICLWLVSILYAHRKDFVFVALSDLFDALKIRVHLKSPLPEFKNNINLVIEESITSEKPLLYKDSASTIIPMLYEFLLILEPSIAEKLYENYQDTFESINLQCWNPPENYHEKLFSEELFDGLLEVSIPLPDDFNDFKRNVNIRHEQFSKEYLPDDFSDKVNGFVALIAFRHFRTPVFPCIWREFINFENIEVEQD